MESLKINRTIQGEIVCKVQGNLYGILIKNVKVIAGNVLADDIILAYKVGNQYNEYPEAKNLEVYIKQQLGNDSVPLQNIVQEVYNKDELDDYIQSADSIRICDKCGNIMDHGWLFEEVGERYCSDECLYQEVTKEEMKQYIEDDVAYYTEWE